MTTNHTQRIKIAGNANIDALSAGVVNLQTMAFDKLRTEDIEYTTLYKTMKSSDEYKSIPAKTAQQVLIDVCNHNKSARVVFTSQQCSIIDGILKFPRIVGLEVKTKLQNVGLKFVRLVKSGIGYMVEIIYRTDDEHGNLETYDPIQTDVDMGTGNTAMFVVCVPEVISEPVGLIQGIISGIASTTHTIIDGAKNVIVKATGLIKSIFGKKNQK